MTSSEVKLKVDAGRLNVHQPYADIAGHPLPSVTTVLNLLANPALYWWYYQQGLDGKDIGKVKQKAFDIGTCAHLLIECHVNGWEADLGDFAKKDIDEAENSFLKFLDFWKGFTLVKSEYQMASTLLGYGGTADIVATDNDGKLCLIDFKTSKAVYDNHRAQLCAYKRLWDVGDVEMVDGKPTVRTNLIEPRIDRMICVRLPKDEPSDTEIHEVRMRDYQKYLDVFDGLLMTYRAKKAANWK